MNKEIKHCDDCKYSYNSGAILNCRWHNEFCKNVNRNLQCKYIRPKDRE